MKIPPNTPLAVSLRWASGRTRRVGRLAQRDRDVFFEYDPGFLERPLPISPFTLKPRQGVLGPFSRTFEGLPGVFNDSLPDGWGRLLVDRRARHQNVVLTPLDRLAIVGTGGIGALIYEPEIEISKTQGAIDLDALAADTRAVLEGKADEVLPELIRLGGSPQGARPKAMIAIAEDGGRIIHGVKEPGPGYKSYLVKFAAQADPADIGPIEFAYSNMAAAAGLRVPAAKLLKTAKGAGYFAAERFDRLPSTRRHVHTLAGLLEMDHRYDLVDYRDVLAATHRLTHDQREVMIMFRLAAFNVLAHNRDDHAKQFSFVMNAQGTWTAAPAYDLTFSDGINGEHTTTVAGEGRKPGKEHLLKLAETLSIKAADAREVIDKVRAAVDRWPRFAEEAGVSGASRLEIDSALNGPRGNRNVER